MRRLYINHNLSKDAKIFAPAEWRAYYCEREFTNDCKGINNAKDVNELIDIFKKNNISHLVLNMNQIESVNKLIANNIIGGKVTVPLYSEEIFLKNPYCRIIFTKKRVFLYELNLKGQSWN